jgi:hypothetical protein
VKNSMKLNMQNILVPYLTICLNWSYQTNAVSLKLSKGVLKAPPYNRSRETTLDAVANAVLRRVTP